MTNREPRELLERIWHHTSKQLYLSNPWRWQIALQDALAVLQQALNRTPPTN